MNFMPAMHLWKEKDIKIQSKHDTIQVWDTEVNILIKAILKALLREAFEPTKETLEYEF